MKPNSALNEIPVPQIRPDNQAFWHATAEGRLLIRRCQSCQQAHWYPRDNCPFCWGNTDWEAASGRATVYTYSITRRADPEPFCIAYVQLVEGPIVMTNIVDCEFDKIRIGDSVHVTFKQSRDGTLVPFFTK